MRAVRCTLPGQNIEGKETGHSLVRIGSFSLVFSKVDRNAVRQYCCQMPTVLWVGPYRFFFYSGDRSEPPHVHVERDSNVAKFWLEPVRLESSGGFGRKDINQIQRHVEDNRDTLLRKWNEFFGL